MEKSIALNIIYLPDEQTRNKAIELSQKLATELFTEFVLNPQNPLPHITIYQALFPTKNLEKIKEFIKDLSSDIKAFEIEMNGFWVNVVRGFVWWNCVKIDQLVKIHLETLEKLNPLREGLVSEGLKTYPGTDDDKNDIENYGSLLVGKRYTPHITITGLKNADNDKKVLEILGNQTNSFRAKSISIGYLGNHGTVTEIIESFSLLS